MRSSASSLPLRRKTSRFRPPNCSLPTRADMAITAAPTLHRSTNSSSRRLKPPSHPAERISLIGDSWAQLRANRLTAGRLPGPRSRRKRPTPTQRYSPTRSMASASSTIALPPRPTKRQPSPHGFAPTSRQRTRGLDRPPPPTLPTRVSSVPSYSERSASTAMPPRSSRRRAQLPGNIWQILRRSIPHFVKSLSLWQRAMEMPGSSINSSTSTRQQTVPNCSTALFAVSPSSKIPHSFNARLSLPSPAKCAIRRRLADCSLSLDCRQPRADLAVHPVPLGSGSCSVHHGSRPASRRRGRMLSAARPHAITCSSSSLHTQSRLPMCPLRHAIETIDGCIELRALQEPRLQSWDRHATRD